MEHFWHFQSLQTMLCSSTVFLLLLCSDNVTRIFGMFWRETNIHKQESSVVGKINTFKYGHMIWNIIIRLLWACWLTKQTNKKTKMSRSSAATKLSQTSCILNSTSQFYMVSIAKDCKWEHDAYVESWEGNTSQTLFLFLKFVIILKKY